MFTARVAVVTVAIIVHSHSLIAQPPLARQPSAYAIAGSAPAEDSAAISGPLPSAFPLSAAISAVEEEEARPRWPSWTLRGAGIGLLTGIVLVFAIPCDQVCRTSDMGRSARIAGIPYFIIAGGVIGGVAGLLADAKWPTCPARP